MRVRSMRKMFLFASALFLLLNVDFSAGNSNVQVSKPSNLLFKFAGPFRVLVRNTGDCPLDMVGSHRIRMYGFMNASEENNPLYSGAMETLDPFDDSLSLESIVAAWSPARGWIPNALRMRLGKLCTTFHTMFKSGLELAESHEVNHQKFCPRGPGNFTVKDVPMSFPIHNLAFAYGRWRADVHYFRNGEKVFCQRTFVDTVPLN